MKRQSPNWQALLVPIEEAVDQLFYTCLGDRLNSVECRVVSEIDFVISIERPISTTESYLLDQQQDALAFEIGTTINQALKNRLFVLLSKQFGLPVTSISFLQPTQLQKLNLLVLLDRSQTTLLVEATQRHNL